MKHRQFCEKFLAALNAADFNAMSEMVEPDFVVHEAAGLPYAGDFHGISGWKALSKAVVTTWKDFKLQPLEFLGETEDTFVVRFALSGRSRKTGKPFETTVMELWRFRNDKLREIIPYYWDTHLLASVDAD